MSMKKYTRSTAKGFTLVELIVVIVILAILATIAFLSFGSQSATARDSKRKTDLTGIKSKFDAHLATAGMSSILSLVTWSGNLVNGSVAWSTLSGGNNYQAWEINYTLIGANSADYKDGTSSYKIGSTTLGWGNYQLASKLETDGQEAVTEAWYLVGTFVARTNASVTASSTWGTSPNIVFNLANADAWKFVAWDIVNDSATATWTVVSIWADKKTVTVKWTAWTYDNQKWVQLAESDVTALVASKAWATTPVSTTAAPY